MSTDSLRRRIGVFGGTFDPVHFGHLRTALELREGLALDQVRFVPCAVPPHREAPTVGAALRRRMLQAAVAPEPSFAVDTRELEREGPSYTVDTLASLRAERPDDALCLLLGLDAFVELTAWHQWERLFELAHVVVAQRPGAEVPAHGPIGELLRARATDDPRLLGARAAGAIVLRNVTQLEISSTELRESIRAGIPPRYLMPESVCQIISETGCYAAKS